MQKSPISDSSSESNDDIMFELAQLFKLLSEEDYNYFLIVPWLLVLDSKEKEVSSFDSSAIS